MGFAPAAPAGVCGRGAAGEHVGRLVWRLLRG